MEKIVGISTEEMVGFLEPSGLAIETFTPTAWGGHIPFMFCLVNYMRPRKYVELGSHYGASFFAVCQVIKQNKINCEATAVDLWQGDEHAGIYDESVYKDFTWLLNSRYPEIGKALRKDFNEAVKDFADKSIDLLHIDGLHTYEAVKNDYDTWLPKMSENGVILFHDTVVMERGFGVWKFWDEIKVKYTSFNFIHTHGLGVIVLGKSATNPMVNLINEINQSEALKNSFDNFFTLTGQRAVNDALARLKPDSTQKECSLRHCLKRVIHKLKRIFIS